MSFSRTKYEDCYTPKEAAVSVAIEALFSELYHQNEAFAADRLPYRRATLKQVYKLLDSLMAKAKFDGFIPDVEI